MLTQSFQQNESKSVQIEVLCYDMLNNYMYGTTDVDLRKRAHRAIVRATNSFISGTTAIAGSVADL